MQIEQYKKLIKKSKYNNRKVIIDGIKFDSIKESQKYAELKLLEKAGVIQDLELQKVFELIPKSATERAVKYKADFTYKENGQLVVEDTKGYKTKEYIIKRKLMKWIYPQIKFIES